MVQVKTNKASHFTCFLPGEPGSEQGRNSLYRDLDIITLTQFFQLERDAPSSEYLEIGGRREPLSFEAGENDSRTGDLSLTYGITHEPLADFLEYFLDGDSFVCCMLIDQDEVAGLSSGVKEAGDELGVDLSEDGGRSE